MHEPLARGRADYSLIVTTGPERGAGTTGRVLVNIRGFGCAVSWSCLGSHPFVCNTDHAPGLQAFGKVRIAISSNTKTSV